VGIRRSILAFRVAGLAVAIIWGALVWNALRNGYSLIAVAISLPLIATLLAVIRPGRGLGHFAFTHEMGPDIDASLPPWQQQYALARWWLLGAGLVPVGFIFASAAKASGLFEETSGIYPVVGGVIPLLGVACLLKSPGAAWRGFRIKQTAANNKLQRTRGVASESNDG
jgi:hypothetical protein